MNKTKTGAAAPVFVLCVQESKIIRFCPGFLSHQLNGMMQVLDIHLGLTGGIFAVQ